MRFLLLARARATGFVRLLSDRAYESRSAAVDAATMTALAIDLVDDEVLAVDLDAAGPVLVLRLPAVAAQPATSSAPPATAPVGPFSPFFGSGSDPVAVSGVPFGDETASPEAGLRLQPRFPLFGIEDEPVEEDLAEALRRIARRMETDLTAVTMGEWATPDESWDARTLDDYALPDDSHLTGAREEGRLRGDAASALERRDDAPVEAEQRFDERWSHVEDLQVLDDEEVWTESEDPVAAVFEDPIDVASWPDPVGSEEPVVADPGEAYTDEAVSREPYECLPVPVDAPEPERFDVADLSIEPAVEQPRDEDAPEAPRWEPEPYRPSNVDFAIWVCADCVYQRTCRKAGVATPATCGNFQWKSF